jgi:rod shape-determining protein MreB
MGGVVVGKSIEVGGVDFDEAIISYVKMKYGLLIGNLTAEKVKIEIGDLTGEAKKKKQFLVRGRDLETGLPKSINLGDSEVREAMSMLVEKIVKTVARVLDETAPELMEDVLKRGVVMVGGGANLTGLDKMIERGTGVTVRVAEDAALCVVKGTGELIANKDLLEKVNLISGYGNE